MRNRRLNALTRETVSELLDRTGHALRVDDFDALMRLNQLAEAVTRPADRAEQDVLNLPVPCGRATLRRPSLAKCFWYERRACVWFRGDPLLLNLALGYICAIENTEDALYALAGPEATQAALEAFAASLTCSEAEYEAAKALVLPEPSEDDDGDPVDYGPTARLLSKVCGGTPQYWMHEADIGFIRAMLDDYAAEVQAEHNSRRRSSIRGQGKRKGGSIKPTAPPRTPQMNNLKRFREYKLRLMQRWQTKQKSE